MGEGDWCGVWMWVIVREKVRECIKMCRDGVCVIDGGRKRRNMGMIGRIFREERRGETWPRMRRERQQHGCGLPPPS